MRHSLDDVSEAVRQPEPDRQKIPSRFAPCRNTPGLFDLISFPPPPSGVEILTFPRMYVGFLIMSLKI